MLRGGVDRLKSSIGKTNRQCNGTGRPTTHTAERPQSPPTVLADQCAIFLSNNIVNVRQDSIPASKFRSVCRFSFESSTISRQPETKPHTQTEVWEEFLDGCVPLNNGATHEGLLHELTQGQRMSSIEKTVAASFVSFTWFPHIWGSVRRQLPNILYFLAPMIEDRTQRELLNPQETNARRTRGKERGEVRRPLTLIGKFGMLHLGSRNSTFRIGAFYHKTSNIRNLAPVSPWEMLNCMRKPRLNLR